MPSTPKKARQKMRRTNTAEYDMQCQKIDHRRRRKSGGSPDSACTNYKEIRWLKPSHLRIVCNISIAGNEIRFTSNEVTRRLKKLRAKISKLNIPMLPSMIDWMLRGTASMTSCANALKFFGFLCAGFLSLSLFLAPPPRSPQATTWFGNRQRR